MGRTLEYSSGRHPSRSGRARSRWVEGRPQAPSVGSEIQCAAFELVWEAPQHVSADDSHPSKAADGHAARDPDAADIPAGGAALAHTAHDLDSLLRTAMATADAGDLEGAIGRLRQYAATVPGSASALGHLAMLEQRAGHYAQAEASYRRVLDLMPDHASTLQCLANVLVLQDKFHGATPIYEDLRRRLGPRLGLETALCRCYLQEARWSEAVALGDRILAADPYHAGVISMRDVARHELGEGDNDASRIRALISAQALPNPRGYDSTAALNRALVDQIRGRADLVENPHDKTTRGGSQTGDLMANADGAVERLGVAIKTAVEAFLAMSSTKPRNDYWARPMANLRLALWATVLKAGGHQEPHIHHLAWLSGVYYARLPEGIHPDDPSRSGWIEFGQPPSRYPCRARYPTECVCPREGMLLMFPSYLFHRTIPLQGDDIRISFAFDVIAQ